MTTRNTPTTSDAATSDESDSRRFGRRTLIKTTTLAAVAGAGFSGSANAQPTCPTDVTTQEEPGLVIVGPDSIVEDTVSVQVEAADDQDDDDSLFVEVSIGGGDWTEASYAGATGYYEYEWDTTSVSDGEYTIEARVVDGDNNTDTAERTVIVDNETETGIVEDFERDDPISAYRGSVGAFGVETESVYNGEQALIQDSGDFAGVAHTGGENEDLLPSRGDEAHYYFKNAGQQNFVSIHHLAQSQEDNPDGYTIGISGSDEALKVWLVENGSIQALGTAELSIWDQIEDWYRLEVRTDETHVYTDLYDDAGDELLASIEVEDATWTQGGIGFRSAGNGEIWDTVVLNPQAEDSPELTGPSSGTATEESTDTAEPTDTEESTTSDDFATPDPATTEDATPSPDEATESMPGFGVLGAIGSVLGLGYAARRFGSGGDRTSGSDD